MPNKRSSENQEEETREESSSDLKSREYRGSDGEVHHHTKKYMQQHRGEKKQKE